MKRLLSLVAAVLMIASIMPTAFAAEIQPRYEPCPECRTGYLRRVTELVHTYEVEDRACVHPGRRGQDTRYHYIYEIYDICTSCGADYRIGSDDKYEWVCEGVSG